MLSREEAIKRLTRRYEEQCLKFPMTRDTVTLDGYIKANLPYVLKSWRGCDALLEYADLGASDKPEHKGTVLP